MTVRLRPDPSKQARASARASCPIVALFVALGACTAETVQTAPPAAVDGASSVEGVSSGDVQAADAATAAKEARARQAAEVEAEARRITAEVATARELEVTGEFAVQLIDKPGVRAFVREAMYEELSAEEIQLLGRVDAALGVLPVGSDGEQVMLDLYEFGVLGIYDPKRKTLLIGDFLDGGQLDMVVGHEGAHGLQDMHFDLEAMSQMNRGRSDLDTARTFLVEGDAQAAYLAWLTGSGGLESIPDALLDTQADMVLQLRDGMGVPYPTLARMLQMPYTEGTNTVVRLARDQGWAEVDALYGEMPTSSEQLLHAEKLAKREPAVAVTIDPQPVLDLARGHSVIWEDELGEAALLAMLAGVATPGVAREAAAGWGGDRYFALERETGRAAAPLLVGVITWDSRAEAQQFEPVFRDYLRASKGDDGFVLERRRATLIYATHFADALDPQLGDPAAALRKAAWNCFALDGSKPASKARSGRKSK